MSLDEVRNQPGIKLTIAEAIAAVAVLIAAFSALSGWIILPEQVRTLKEADATQNARIAAIEIAAQDKAVILARIDERTKRIEEAIGAHTPLK